MLENRFYALLVLQYFIYSQVNDAGEWVHWNTKVPEYIYPKDSVPDYPSILVPNVDNVRTDFLINTIQKQVSVENKCGGD